MKNSLYTKINTSNALNKDLINKWNTAIPILAAKYVQGVKEISASTANVYRFDLYGLFLNVFLIQENYIYPHIRVNGYDCSNNYDGKKLRFILLDPMRLSLYYNLFTK